MKTVHVLVKGKVQGVFYRASAKEMAVKMGISGWVKNTRDGNVELMITGEKDNIESYIAWCRQGPERAKVEELIWEEKESTSFNDFQIVR